MTISIALAGKGGTGKTTFASLLIRSLVEAGIRPILAVDADPNSNLAEALGVEAGTTLAEIREYGSSPEGSPASGVGRVRAVEDEVQRSIAEADHFDLIVMGRPEGPRCYCSVNNLLRKSLDTLGRNYEAIVIDNEAGMEHLSRRTTHDVDYLVAMGNPTVPSLRAMKRILDLSRTLPIRIGRRMIQLTRVGPGGAPGAIERELAELQFERLPNIPQDDTVERTGAEGLDVFHLPAESPALLAVQSVVRRLCEMALT
jgi:CO dehydrogenase maturation factor